MTTKNYSLYNMLDDAYRTDYPDDRAIGALEDWYSGLATEQATVLKLVKLGVIENAD